MAHARAKAIARVAAEGKQSAWPMPGSRGPRHKRTPDDRQDGAGVR
jgi:hypothetical protein